MKVLNPIYDTVFKFLMEDIEVAQGLISLIIEENVVELIPAPQEQTSTEIKLKYHQLPLQRLDYVAIIKTTEKDGSDKYHKVCVEVQKSPFIPELGRFRKYVSEKYACKSEYKTENGVETDYLPLKTIYFVDKAFNKNLPAVLRRKGEYWDVLNEKKYVGKKDQYVELLNHDAWFIQVQNLPPTLKSELLYCLSVFAPWLRDGERFINIPENDEGLKKYKLLTKIINRLYLAGKSREVETALELEISLETYIGKVEMDRLKAQKREKEAQKREKEAQKREKEAQKREKEKSIKLAKRMKKYNEPIEEIQKETGLSKEEIENL